MAAKHQRRFCLVEFLHPPGEWTPLHIHKDSDQTQYVLEGELTVHLPGRTVVVGPGECVNTPINVPHTECVSSASPARVLDVNAPAGFDEYAGAAGKIYEQPKRLERLGYLRSEKRPGKTNDRTYYTLTKNGLAALREWLGRPSPFPRIQSEAVARVLASDLAEDERVVAESLQAMREDIGELAAGIEADERRATSFPHRERQLRLVRSLGRRLLQAHLDWINEVEQELGSP